ncbi:ParB N-terminal domain-containing protein [Streptomyces bobili]|uniref:ParB/RepB/Spo0J family partition protein n=1 Tax=Streptomyces bobili TaxID=67280 RepID=UPI00341F4453
MPRNGAGGSTLTPADTIKLEEKPFIQAPKPRGSGITVPIEQIAPCPRNLRGDDLWPDPEERDRMVASLKRKGLIQALVVVDVAEYVAHYPEDEEAFSPDHRYVVVAGHCRLDAAPDAGLTDLRVDVQNEHASDVDSIFLDENLNRQALTCFQEGEGYRRLRVNKGWSDKEIAEHYGFSKSKSRVTKRIAILPLVEVTAARESILSSERGSLTPDKAYTIISVVKDPQLVMPTYELMTARNLDAREAGRLLQLSTIEAEKTATPIPHPATSAESAPPASENKDEQTLTPGGEQQPGQGDGTDGGETTGSDRTDSADSGTDDEQGAKNESGGHDETSSKTGNPPKQQESRLTDMEKQQIAADARREQACKLLVQEYREPLVDGHVVRTAATTLAMVGSQTVRLAHKWLSEIESSSAQGYSSPTSYRDHVLAGQDGALMLQVAYAVALADDELRAQDRRRKPDFRVIRHWRYLIEAAKYEPSSWEQQYLR